MLLLSHEEHGPKTSSAKVHARPHNPRGPTVAPRLRICHLCNADSICQSLQKETLDANFPFSSSLRNHYLLSKQNIADAIDEKTIENGSRCQFM
jgi:hypothetical protein